MPDPLTPRPDDPTAHPAADVSAAVVSPAESAALIRACELARLGTGTALPNPVVGCVILAPDGETVGEGFHHHAGGPHAEVVALAAAGDRARGATAVVTLEPCNHTGRTGPCSEALLAAGVARVVVAVRDPWPRAAGGIERLREAGVDVVDLSHASTDLASTDLASTGHAARGRAAADAAAALRGAEIAAGVVPHGVVAPAAPGHEIADLVAAAEDVNRVWLGALRRGRPFVTLKMAMSLDGRVAAPDGTSRWISSPESRADAHRMRGEIDAILVGVGTVLADDPSLTARNADGESVGRQPLRVVADTHGRTPADAKVRDGQAESLIATAAEYGVGPDGRLDLGRLLADLFERGRRHLLVEGGPRVAASFLDAGLVDEVLIYVAPLLLGAGRIAVDGGALATLADARHLELCETRLLGPDLALRYRMLHG